MKVNFQVELIDLDGNSIKKTEVVKDKEVCAECGATSKIVELDECVMLASPIIAALSGNYQEDRQLDPVEKLNRFALSLELKKGGITELTVEDASLIKKYAAMGCTILAHGRIVKLIESVESKEDKKDNG